MGSWLRNSETYSATNQDVWMWLRWEWRLEKRPQLPPYRLPYSKLNMLQEEVKQLLKEGLVQQSTSTLALPILLEPNKDGSNWLCIDYRRLNLITTPDLYPMPRVDDLIDRFGAETYITILDLTKGYWQLPMTEEARKKTAFVIPWGK